MDNQIKNLVWQQRSLHLFLILTYSKNSRILSAFKINRFDENVVIVTGSSSGIGQAVLLGFAKENASVVIHGVNQKRLHDTEVLLKENGIPENRFLTVQGEIQDEKVQEKLIEETVAKFGKINVLVNNTGTGPKGGADDYLSIENFDYVMNVNFRA